MGEWVSTILTDRESMINNDPWNKIYKHHYSLSFVTKISMYSYTLPLCEDIKYYPPIDYCGYWFLSYLLQVGYSPFKK